MVFGAILTNFELQFWQLNCILYNIFYRFARLVGEIC